MIREVLIGLAAVAIATVSQPAAAAQDAPGLGVLRVEDASLDLGEIPAGGDVVATFTLHNDGQRDIRILRAKPS
jgi:copper(I)-binding protein